MKYILKTFNGKQQYEHRYVWEQHNGKIPPKMQIHHINGNKHDNRIENLSMISSAENNRKTDQLGKGYKFRHRLKKRPYEARRRVNGKDKTLGYFGTICGAIMASRMAYITN